MLGLPRRPEISPKTEYFLAVFVAIYTLTFVAYYFWGVRPLHHYEIPLRTLSAGKSALIALFVALVVAFLAAKKKFD